MGKELYMAEKRAQDKQIKAGRNKRELAVYFDRSIVALLDLKPGQPIVLTADKDKRQIIVQL